MISTSFADIFKGNALKNSLLPIVVPPTSTQSCSRCPKRRSQGRSGIQTITLPDGETVEFPVDPFSKTCLLEGIDELGWILKHVPAISAFEAGHPGTLNTLA